MGPSGAWLLRGARSPHISACEGFLELEKPLWGILALWGTLTGKTALWGTKTALRGILA